MTKKPLPSALPVEGDIFLALPLWWSSMPDSRGYRLCALRRTIPREWDEMLFRFIDEIEEQLKKRASRKWTEQQSNSKNCMFSNITPSPGYVRGNPPKWSKSSKLSKFDEIWAMGGQKSSKYPPPPKMVILPLYKRLFVGLFPPAPLYLLGVLLQKKVLATGRPLGSGRL